MILAVKLLIICVNNKIKWLLNTDSKIKLRFLDISTYYITSVVRVYNDITIRSLVLITLYKR